ncbi:nucleoside diphosphate kinase regulator, partial [Cellvibrio sp.]
EALNIQLNHADIVPDRDIPDDAVTMGSQVTFVDLDSNEEQTISLVYPNEADVTQMKISILSPVGSALIGLRIGGNIDWPVPQGKVRRLKVIAVQHPV